MSFNRRVAFPIIVLMWLVQVKSLEYVKPRCLCDVTSLTAVLSMKRGGWYGLMRFLLAINDSIFIELNITSHVFAQDMMVLR